MFDGSISNEKFVDSISKKNMDFIPCLTFGKVIQNYDDNHPKKVKVKLRNSMGIEDNEIWADVLSLYGGNGYGSYNIPEVNSEVVVAFAMNNRAFPIVIGNIWTNQEDLPPNTADKDNYIKRFKTLAGNDICIDDTENKSLISIKTVKGLNMCFNDENNQISIYDDDNTNQLQIDFKNKALSIDAKEKISLKIDGQNVITIDKQSVTIETKTTSIKSNSKIELNGGQISASGTDISLKSKGNLGIKSNGNLSAEATGIAKVKGSLLNLN